MLKAHPRALRLPLRHPVPRTSHHHIEVHPKNPNIRIIPCPQVNMFHNPKPEVARLREVPRAELVFLDFQTAFEDFFGFGSADGDVDGDFFVTTDAEAAEGVPRFGGDGRLAGELFEDFGRAGQSVTRFADADVCTLFRYDNDGER